MSVNPTGGFDPIGLITGLLGGGDAKADGGGGTGFSLKDVFEGGGGGDQGGDAKADGGGDFLSGIMKFFGGLFGGGDGGGGGNPLSGIMDFFGGLFGGGGK